VGIPRDISDVNNSGDWYKKEKRENSRPGGAKLGHEPHNHLLGALRDRAVSSVIFNVFAGNARAVAFYEAMGAERLGTEQMHDAPKPYLDYVYRIGTTQD
jgi:hypothetical protein